jgi:hypothetical protein
MLILEQQSFFLQKTVKFLSHKNNITHSFVSIDDYPMSEVRSVKLGARKMQKKIGYKKINM